MFSPIQIKQEYTNGEDAAQCAATGIPINSDYQLFSNQETECMYRQLPHFWGQTQFQLTSFSNPPKNEVLKQEEQHPPTQLSVTSYLLQQQQQLQHFPMSQVEETPMLHGQLPSQTCPPLTTQEPQMSQQLVDRALLTAMQTTLPKSQNGPGRPPKSVQTAVAKKTKCQCEICFKEFGHKSNLFIHMRTHNGERPYKCNQCNKCFTHSGNLAIHMRTHSGERPYACQICGKMFSHSGNLSTHLRTHSGVKPYKCGVCSKEFRHSGNLSIHERIHSGVKPFQCKVCGKEFYHSGNLTTHMKKHPTGVSPPEHCENNDMRVVQNAQIAEQIIGESVQNAAMANGVKNECNDDPRNDRPILMSTS